MKSKYFEGGDKLKAILEDYSKRIQKGELVQVGWQEDATYSGEDGEASLPVAYVAMINEYGGTVNVPEHQAEIYRSINKKTGYFNKKGRFVRKEDSNFATTHTVPAHTITTPPRPFIRQTIARCSDEWGTKLGKILKANNYDSDISLQKIGDEMQKDIVDTILAFTDPKNAKSTIANKGFDKPLIHTGHMKDTITATVVNK